MPQASAGKNIVDSAQVNAGVIESTDIKDNDIAAVDIATSAIETAEIKDGEIVNADINASAAIVDTKLAQITTAGKVSGAALTSLSSIPAGAGLIPAANLPGGSDIVAIPMPLLHTVALGTRSMSNNVDGFIGAFKLDHAITVNKITLNVTAVGAAGVYNIGIFSMDGQTRHISVATASISGTGKVTTAVGAVTLPAGIYYYMMGSVGSANVTFSRWTPLATASDMRELTSEPTLCGQYTVTASTMPATVTPASIAATDDGGTFLFRLDN